MTRGTVTRAWARLHHPRWYREVTGEEPRRPHADLSVASDFERRAARAETLAGNHPAVADPLRFAAGSVPRPGGLAGILERAHARRSADRAPRRGRRPLPRPRPRNPPLRRRCRPGGPVGRGAARGRRTCPRRGARGCWSTGKAAARPARTTCRGRSCGPTSRRSGRFPCRRTGLTRADAAPSAAARPGSRSGERAPSWKAPSVRSAARSAEPSGRSRGSSAPRASRRIRRSSRPSRRRDTPAVRIETCETCRRYVKSLDLSEDARPIPEVDDLVSLSLDLWALREGLERIEPGLAGL